MFVDMINETDYAGKITVFLEIWLLFRRIWLYFLQPLASISTAD